MKVLLINGSPRREGNTFIALSEAARALEAEGVGAEIVSIGTKAVQGCIACGKCAELGRCVFNDALYNEVREKLVGADALVVGSPVYYAGPNGSLCALLDRLFYSCSDRLAYKPAAAVAVCRRGGASATFDRLNKYFTISNMPVVSSQYWNSVHGRLPGEAAQDAEGLQTMRVLARNMARMLRAGLLASEGRPEPEERVPAGIRARWILDRLENRRDAMGLTPKPAGRRDTDAVTRLVERLDAAGEPDTSGLMERVLDHALDNGFQAKRVDTGRRFARLFDELRDDLTCDQRTLERRRREHADASQPTGSDTGESRPAEPESYETRARRMLADRIGADIDASTAIRALADRLRPDPDPDPGQASRYAELALRAGRKTRAEQARLHAERSRELHDYRASHGGSCFAGNWQLEQAT